MYECSIGPSSTLGFSKVFFGLLIFLGIFRYLLIENSGILVFWYFGIFRAILYVGAFGSIGKIRT